MNSAGATLQFTPNQDEDYHATRQMALRKRSTKGYFIVCGTAIVLLVSALVLGRTGALVLSRMTELVVVLSGLVCLAALSALPYSWRQSVAALWRDNPSAGRPLEVTVSEDGVRIVGPYATHHMMWSAYGKVVETEQFLFLCFSVGWAHILPKRGMDCAELQYVRDVVQRKVGVGGADGNAA